jgi:hypothetical protein
VHRSYTQCFEANIAEVEPAPEHVHRTRHKRFSAAAYQLHGRWPIKREVSGVRRDVVEEFNVGATFYPR